MLVTHIQDRDTPKFYFRRGVEKLEMWCFPCIWKKLPLKVLFHELLGILAAVFHALRRHSISRHVDTMLSLHRLQLIKKAS
jgi:hypothetical protein